MVSPARVEEWRLQYQYVDQRGRLDERERAFIQSVGEYLFISFKMSSWLRSLYKRTQVEVG